MPNGPVNGQVDQTERDTGFVAIPPFTLTQGTQYLDPNPYFGRVLYTHGLALDHPLSITRVEYTDDPQAQSGPGGQGASRWAPLSVVPIWNDRGQAHLFYFADNGAAPYCRLVNNVERCVRGSFPFAWFAYDRALSVPREWHGTLVEDKADEAGTLYRRERYYEPTTGRFTQLDPIGLAGGMNLYGFASGDPVNFSDPLGLCPMCIAYAAFEIGSTAYDLYDLTRTAYAYSRGRASKTALTVTAAGVGAGLVGFGGGYGKAARTAAGFAEGLGRSAFTPNRLQHASRHLTDAGLLGNWSKAAGETFTRMGSEILENPLAGFDHALGGTAVRGFHGKVNGNDVVFFVFKEGKYQGQVATAIVPTAQQMTNWGLK